MLPLFGVLFLGWDTFSIVLLYWVENVIIGAINVLKMLACDPDAELLVLGKVDPNDRLNRERMERSRSDSVRALRWGSQASKLFFVPFFVFHYGLFCLVHGVFVFVLFGHESLVGSGPFGPLSNIAQVFSEQRMWWCVIALAASHLWSFLVNFLGRGEYRRTALMTLMMQPYGRIVLLHVAILLGGFISLALGSNIGILALLIAGKTIFDLGLHLHEREKNATAQRQPIMPDVIPGMMEESPARSANTER